MRPRPLSATRTRDDAQRRYQTFSGTVKIDRIGSSSPCFICRYLFRTGIVLNPIPTFFQLNIGASGTHTAPETEHAGKSDTIWDHHSNAATGQWPVVTACRVSPSTLCRRRNTGQISEKQSTGAIGSLPFHVAFVQRTNL